MVTKLTFEFIKTVRLASRGAGAGTCLTVYCSGSVGIGKRVVVDRAEVKLSRVKRKAANSHKLIFLLNIVFTQRKKLTKIKRLMINPH